VEDCGREQVQTVDAGIGISPPLAFNQVGVQHTLVVTLQTTLDGSTFTNNADGAKVAISFPTGTNTAGATVVPNSNTCATTGISGGQCSVTIVAQKAGSVQIHAKASNFTFTALDPRFSPRGAFASR